MMKSFRMLSMVLMVSNIFYAFQCVEVYEDNTFITLQGKITDESNHAISGLDLIFGQEVFDLRFESQDTRIEFDSLENTFSRRIRMGNTDDSGNFKFIHPSKFTRFFIYKDRNTLFRYMERGVLVERNYIVFERDFETGRFSKDIKNIQVVIP